jgi:hypothetical protein
MSNGQYKTACGYLGSESGSPSGGGCGQTSVTDTLGNIASPTFFAAYKDNSPMTPQNCGLCVQISYGGRSIVATIVDDCASCQDTGHLDLSMPAANAIGLTAGNGDPKSGVTWKSVACAVTGNIVGLFNNGYAGQVYFQNVVFPVASANAGGHQGNFAYGYWDFGTSVAGQSVTLTDALGHTVHGTIPSNSGGSVGTQFPAACK